MVGINECLTENLACEGSCTNVMEVSTLPYLVNANKVLFAFSFISFFFAFMIFLIHQAKTLQLTRLIIQT